MNDQRPRLAVFSTLFPHPGQPNAGVFIRERMFRVGKRLPIVVVAPVPWFPLQGIIRRFRPHFRPMAPRHEMQQGVEVYHPRFFSVPGLFKSLDGLFMALGSYSTLRRLRNHDGVDILDAHFVYPDGYAASLLGKWLDLPVTITLRGTEVPHARDPARRRRMLTALHRAARVFSVSASLKRLAVDLGVAESQVRVVGNGVDAELFQPLPQAAARVALDIPAAAQVLITVGGLVERKGFHRVIELLPRLRREFSELHYLVVGGASAEGDMSAELRRQAAELGVHDRVHFLGPLPAPRLKEVLSAADVFVLATRNEGWANVLLEAMACGLPVVTTDVGGNREVVCRPELGTVVPFGDAAALESALCTALRTQWRRDVLIDYARANAWDLRVQVLVEEFAAIHQSAPQRSAAYG